VNALPPDDCERGLLDWFWALPIGDRFPALQRLAVVIIDRPSEWHAAPHGTPRGAHADTCGVCLNGDRSLARHHIIPVHNGGSDSLRNLITICDVCHSRIHGRVLKNREPEDQKRASVFYQLSEITGGPDLKQWLDTLRRRAEFDTRHAKGTR
jgi:hypothetical protein